MLELPDVNVLVALLDPAHIHHQTAKDWFAQAQRTGWATCSLTESGFVRVLTSTGHNDQRIKPFAASEFLRVFLANHAATHHFFPDDVRILDTIRYDLRHLQGHKQVTDLHLLGLCQQNGLRFVTFDNAIRSTWNALVHSQTDLIHFLLPLPTALP